MVIYQLFSINSSFKVSAKLVLQGSSIKDRSFPTVDLFTSGNNEFLKVMPNPYIEININNTNDRKNGSLRIKKMNFTRRDLCVMIIKLKELVKILFSDNQLFFYDENHDLKVNNEMAERVKLIHQNQNNIVVIRPVVVPLENKMYEGVLYFYGNNYSTGTLLTSYDLEYLLHELEKINLNEIGMNMINMFYLSKNNIVETGTHDIKQNSKDSYETKNTEIVDIKPMKQTNTIPTNI